MARVLYGALVTELRGSIGGTVFQANKFGFTAKNTPCKTDSSSQLALAQRLLLVEAARYWATFSDSDRAYFDSYSTSYPQYAKHNNTAILSGYTIFCKWYIAFRLANYSYPSGYISTNYASYSYAPSIARVSSTLIIDLNASETFSDYYFTLFASLPVPNHRNYIPKSFRLIGSLSLANQSSDLSAGYTAAFGFIPSTGDTVFLRVVGWHRQMPWVVAAAYFKIIVS